MNGESDFIENTFVVKDEGVKVVVNTSASTNSSNHRPS